MEIKDINEFETELFQMSHRPLSVSATQPTSKGQPQMVKCAFDEINDLTSLHMANYLDSYKSASSCSYPTKKHDCMCYFKVFYLKLCMRWDQIHNQG